MNKRALGILEYNKIIDMLSERAMSPMAKNFASKVRPLSDIYTIRDLLEETSEAARVISIKGNLPMGAFYDIAGFVNYARKGGVLTMSQLLKVLYNMRTARMVRGFLDDAELGEIPVLGSMAELLELQKDLEQEIDRCILSDDEMADNASSQLRSIRRSIQRQGEEIKLKMNRIASAAENKDMLRDSIVTMRDGRYVIPVKQEYRSRFGGIVHDQSAKGSTLFIEPQSIVNMNNELKQLYLDEEAEVQRILQELSERTAEHHYALVNNQKMLVKLDFIFAKGRLSCDMGAEEPRITDGEALVLKEARHPLIPRDKVVPIDVSIGEDYRTLVITGPNTGGKTVTLKTVGLLGLMALSGLHIPASSQSCVPMLRDIFADIGDEQSIEQSLSTFSSHMTNIVDIVKKARQGTLVLLDELGAGTDPTEGAALAIAILDKLYDKGAMSISTTHYNELKKYAITKEGVENASMQFDVETLSPTYRLIIGAPGRSNAFEIASKLGLSKEIVDNASRMIGEGDLEFEDAVSALDADRQAARELREEAERLQRTIEQKQQEMERREAEFKKKKEKMMNEAREEARGIIREAKDISKEVQKELKDAAGLASSDLDRSLERTRSKLREAESKYRDVVIKEVNDRPVKASELKKGDRVKVLTLGQTGEILSLPDQKGMLKVQVGLMKANVNLEDLVLIEQTKENKQKSRRTYSAIAKAKTQTVKTSIDVRGNYLDDAIAIVEKYLDDAFVAGLKQVTIIHGRGEGILSKGIRAWLKKNKYAKKFRPGTLDEGGDGATVVTLDK